MLFDGNDVQYLLKKKGLSLTDVARQLNVSKQNIHQVIFGKFRSQNVINHIENLLDIEPGTLEISERKREELVKVA